MNKIKSLMFIIPLSFVLLSLTSANHNTSDNTIARGGGHAGGGGFESHGMDAGRSGFDNRGMDAGRNNGANRNWNNNYNGGYGGGAYYNGGYYNAGYGPVLLPDTTQDPNDDMNQIYQQNLQNMERTGL